MPRHLILVLGDQLDAESAAFDGFDPAQDAILQLEVGEEASYIPQHKRRLAFFFAAMRHFRDEQRITGRTVHYSELDDPDNRGNFLAETRRWLDLLHPQKLILLEPGDWRVRQLFESLDYPCEIRDDRHFLCSTAEFTKFVEQHRAPILETFYRQMRKRHDILMEPDGKPTGGAWNFDHDNRQPYRPGKSPPIPPLPVFAPDATTNAVLAMVERMFPGNPGSLADFSLPVTRAQALAALADFVAYRLDYFGLYQDAMLDDEPFLFHSLLSGPLNLHLLHPMEIVQAVLASRTAPLNAVEGFVRQIIGWREFMRGIYWQHMPDYAGRNELAANLPMPRFYWTGKTEMNCLAHAIHHTIDNAYAHHIERLMVLGLFALLLGVRPYDVHRWHLSMFWDAIDWVSLPNTLGMSQHADGGVAGTKPYVASGNYIDRMSNHCRGCCFDPHQSVGEAACPFTTLYWDFLARHRDRFARNMRMKNQYHNLDRKDPGEVELIRQRAEWLKMELTSESFL